VRRQREPFVRAQGTNHGQVIVPVHGAGFDQHFSSGSHACDGPSPDEPPIHPEKPAAADL
jgi:hypothetical protein